MNTGKTPVLQEFDRQVQNLLSKGYPQEAQLSDAHFLTHIEPLRGKIEEIITVEKDVEQGRLPFVIVIKSVRTATANPVNSLRTE